MTVEMDFEYYDFAYPAPLFIAQVKAFGGLTAHTHRFTRHSVKLSHVHDSFERRSYAARMPNIRRNR